MRKTGLVAIAAVVLASVAGAQAPKPAELVVDLLAVKPGAPAALPAPPGEPFPLRLGNRAPGAAYQVTVEEAGKAQMAEGIREGSSLARITSLYSDGPYGNGTPILNAARIVELPRPRYDFGAQPGTRIRNGTTIREHALTGGFPAWGATDRPNCALSANGSARVGVVCPSTGARFGHRARCERSALRSRGPMVDTTSGPQ